MAINKLGRLQPIDLREVWAKEDIHFTPWLAQDENIALLSETIGLDLEVQSQEHLVGPFRADIVCKETANDNFVLIENQLEKTNHTHLGQILTYAAGVNAVTVVWIAKAFTEEHRAAMDWLNNVTNKEINFFGLEVELWRIGDSNIAPKFNIVSKPNDWSKSLTSNLSSGQNKEITDSKQLQLDYWTAFNDFVKSKTTTVKATKPLPQHWMNVSIGRSGTKLSAVASFVDSESGSFETNEIRAEVVLYDERSKENFHQLLRQKDAIEKELGLPLKWHNPENARMCRIILRKSVDLRNRSEWKNQHAWILSSLENLQNVFAKRIKNLI